MVPDAGGRSAVLRASAIERCISCRTSQTCFSSFYARIFPRTTLAEHTPWINAAARRRNRSRLIQAQRDTTRIPSPNPNPPYSIRHPPFSPYPIFDYGRQVSTTLPVILLYLLVTKPISNHILCYFPAQRRCLPRCKHTQRTNVNISRCM